VVLLLRPPLTIDQPAQTARLSELPYSKNKKINLPRQARDQKPEATHSTKQNKKDARFRFVLFPHRIVG
jgi:hypothetical protein